MQFTLLLVLMILMGMNTGCNTPGGDTSVINSKSTALILPKAFQFSEVKAANGTVVFSWQASKNATDYKIYQGSSSSSISTDVTSNCDVSARTCSISGLGASPQFFSIDAINSDGIKQVTAIKEVRSVSTFDISTVATGDKQLTISWGSSTGATQYAILYSTATSATSVVTYVTSPYTLTGLTNNSTYIIRVLAMNNFNGYLLNTSTNKSGTPIAAPAKPTNLALSATPTSVNLTWNHAGGTGVTYKIFRGISPTVLSEIASGVTLQSYTDLSTIPGTHYYYYVKAYNGTSSAASIPTQEIRPIGTFSLISFTANSRSDIDLQWTEAVGADTYEVNYGFSAGVYLQTQTVTAPDLFANLSGLNFDTNHFILVKAKNAIGPSGTTQNSTDGEIQVATLANQTPIMGEISAQETETESIHVVNFTISDQDDVLDCNHHVRSSSEDRSLQIEILPGPAPYCSAVITTTEDHDEGRPTIITFDTDDGNSGHDAKSFDLSISCKVAFIEWLSGSINNTDAGNTMHKPPQFALLRTNREPCRTNKKPISLNLVYESVEAQRDAEILGRATLIPNEGIVDFGLRSKLERAGTFKVVATQGNVSSEPSNLFTVNPLVPTKLMWHVLPITSSLNNGSFNPTPEIRVSDIYGNYVQDESGYNINLDLNDPNGTAANLQRDGYGQFFHHQGGGRYLGHYFSLDRPGDNFSLVAHTDVSILWSEESPQFNIIDSVMIPQNVVATFEMLQGPIIIPTKNTPTEVVYDRSTIPLGSNYIDGNRKIKWKLVATNKSKDPAIVKLISGGEVTRIDMPPSQRPITLTQEFDDKILSPDADWKISVTGSDVTIFSSTILIEQNEATRTQVYIPLSSIEPTNSKGYIEYASDKKGNYKAPNSFNFHPFPWDSRKFERIESIHLLVSFASGDEGTQTCAALFDRKSDKQIGENVCTDSIRPESVFTIPLKKNEFDMATDIEIRFNDGRTNTSPRIYKAGLIVRLVDIKKLLNVQTLASAHHSLHSELNLHENTILNPPRPERASLFEKQISCYGSSLDSQASGSFTLFPVQIYDPNNPSIDNPEVPVGITSDRISFYDFSHLDLVFKEGLNLSENQYYHLDYSLQGEKSQQLSECQFIIETQY